MYSLIIPVYRNEESLTELVGLLGDLNLRLKRDLEVVFVVDASPDSSYLKLKQLLPAAGFRSQLILLSRNFGSFSAIRAGLSQAGGKYFAVMAADLQEPPEIIEQFFEQLQSGECDIVLGTRERRQDPLFSRLASGIFWKLYRRFVMPEMPKGGIDIFAVNTQVRAELLLLKELNTSLVGLLMWVGFRRTTIGYERRARKHGRSAWTFRKKVRYFMDSIFAFSDLPIRLLFLIGFTTLLVAAVLSAIVLAAKTTEMINIPGYATTIILISGFAGFNAISLGILGAYIWRAFENTKDRPQSIIMNRQTFP